MGKLMQKTILIVLVVALISLGGITLYSAATIKQIEGLTEKLDYSRKRNESNISEKKIARLKYTEADFAQIREHVDQIETLILRGSSIDLTTTPTSIAIQKGYFVDTYKQYLANIAPNINVFIELDGAFSSFDAKQLSQDQLNVAVETFVGYIESNNYRGVAVHNTENTSLENSPLLTTLATALKGRGKKILVVQNPDFIPITPQLQNTFDSVLLFPQSTTPIQLETQKWTSSSLLPSPKEIVSKIKSFVTDNNITKYLLLLDTTTYKETRENNLPIWQTFTSYSEILNTFANPEITYPADTLVPTIVQKANDYVTNYVYLADSTYVYNVNVAFSKEKQLLQPFKVGLSSEFPSEPGVWNTISNLNSQNSLAYIKASYMVDTAIEQTGKGSIFKYLQDAIPGSRAIELTNEFITNQVITKQPIHAKIQRFGYKENVVAITFDDGPDADTTPKILDILNEKGIKATFFLEGSHVKTNIDLTKRIVADGHSIANHTYNHPFTYKLPTNTYSNELEATDRILHLTTGYKTHLYRTPFNQANAFQTMSDGENLKFLNSKGYLVSEFDIDSNDYLDISGDEIKANIMKSLSESKGGQILFHDHNLVSRQELVSVLPELLDEIKSSGYQFALSDELVDAGEYFSGIEGKDSSSKAIIQDRNLNYWMYNIGFFLLNNFYLLVILALITMMYWYIVV